jgi:hypothetical protein
MSEPDSFHSLDLNYLRVMDRNLDDAKLQRRDLLADDLQPTFSRLGRDCIVH